MWKAFKVVNLFYLLVSTNIWFAFLLPRYILPIVCAVIMAVCVIFGGFKLKVTSRVFLILVMFILYSLYTSVILGFSAGLWTFMTYLPALLLFILDVPMQNDLLKFITKWVCVILGVSLGFFLINIVVPLPYVDFLPRDLDGTYAGFENYGFFLKNVVSLADMSDISRFCGPFLEPGHQSTLSCLLLFANQFRVRKQPLLWILLASVLFSFSLAGYLICVIGFLLVSMRNVYSMIAVTALVAGSWLFVTELWNGGNNPVNVLIVQRLEFDKEKGISGNNRTAKVTDYFYKDSVKDGTVVFGVQGSKRALEKVQGAGYKIFFLRYGIVAAVFVLVIYIMLIPSGSNTRYSISFLFLIALVFMQRAYPDWYSWLLPYVLGIGISRSIPMRFSTNEEDTDSDDNLFKISYYR